MPKNEIRPMWVLNIKRPWEGPRSAECEIHIGPKQIYGVALYKTGRRLAEHRHFYGVSMFGTQEAALRECYARMNEFEKNWYNQRFFWEGVHACRELLKARKNAR